MQTITAGIDPEANHPDLLQWLRDHDLDPRSIRQVQVGARETLVSQYQRNARGMPLVGGGDPLVFTIRIPTRKALPKSIRRCLGCGYSPSRFPSDYVHDEAECAFDQGRVVAP